jgi:general secretion pathway protein G
MAHRSIIKIYGKPYYKAVFKQNAPRRVEISSNKGFSLVELITVIGIIAALAAMTIPAFNNYVNNSKKARAASEIRTLSTEISGYYLDRGYNPATLADINRPNYKDPWKRDYVYYNFTATPVLPLPLAPAAQAPLKDFINIPINTDFDLYSLGQDGNTAEVAGVAVTDDDIARFNNGSHVGWR